MSPDQPNDQTTEAIEPESQTRDADLSAGDEITDATTIEDTTGEDVDPIL